MFKVQAGINVKKIERELRDSGLARQFLTFVASREFGNGDITAEDLLSCNSAAQRGDAISFLHALEDAGCGLFRTGRRGRPTRLEWTSETTPQQLAVEIGIQASPMESNGGRGMTLQHQFNIRPDFRVDLRLPQDLSVAEADRLASFVKTLPFNSN